MTQESVHGKAEDSRWEMRRNDIIDVAAQLFAKDVYHASGLADICDAVGLARGAVYYYIESKENLLALIHERVMSILLISAHQIQAMNSPPVRQIEQLCFDLISTIMWIPDHVWVFLHELRNLAGERASAAFLRIALRI